MTLWELAWLVGADAKWITNALAALTLPNRYSLSLAHRLALVRELVSEFQLPLATALALADRALATDDAGDSASAPRAFGDACVSMTIDIARMHSVVNTRHSALLTTVEPRQRGRPVARARDPRVVAAEWGIDLSLLVENVRHRTPAQALRTLDAMHAIPHTIRRVAERAP